MGGFCPRGKVFNTTLQTWFSREIALGLKGCFYKDHCCVVCQKSTEGCIAHVGYVVKLDIGAVSGLLHNNKNDHKTFKTSSSFSFFLTNVSLVVICHWVPFRHISWRHSGIHATCFPSAPIPPCLYSSAIQLLLVSAETPSVLYCSLMRVAIPQIYVTAEGWLPYFLHG